MLIADVVEEVHLVFAREQRRADAVDGCVAPALCGAEESRWGGRVGSGRVGSGRRERRWTFDGGSGATEGGNVAGCAVDTRRVGIEPNGCDAVGSDLDDVGEGRHGIEALDHA